MVPQLLLRDVISETGEVKGCDIFMISLVRHSVVFLESFFVSSIFPSECLPEAHFSSLYYLTSKYIYPPPSVSFSNHSLSPPRYYNAWVVVLANMSHFL